MNAEERNFHYRCETINERDREDIHTLIYLKLCSIEELLMDNEELPEDSPWKQTEDTTQENFLNDKETAQVKLILDRVRNRRTAEIVEIKGFTK